MGAFGGEGEEGGKGVGERRGSDFCFVKILKGFWADFVRLRSVSVDEDFFF